MIHLVTNLLPEPAPTMSRLKNGRLEQSSGMSYESGGYAVVWVQVPRDIALDFWDIAIKVSRVLYISS